MASNEIRLQVPAMAVYQSALSEAAHKITSRKGWPSDRVDQFVSLTELATIALCSYDASSMAFVIDQTPDGLQGTLSGIGGSGAATPATVSSFEALARSTAADWHVDAASGVLSFEIT